MAKNRTVAKMLGEAADVPDPQMQAAAHVPSEAPPEQIDYSNPSVEQLLELWNSGNHEAVGLRVLDALDHYRDFLALAFRIGQEGALELGQIMDELTSTEKSPHKFDQMPDDNLDLKSMRRPGAGVPDAVDAAGSSE